MEGSWRKMCFSPALKWLKCSARASILWLNESGTISRGASFWCAGAWSQPASDQRSPASVWLKETRWDWLENLCNARAPAAAAHAPSQHSPRPKGRRKLGGMGSDLWRFLMDLRLVDVRGCLFSAHPLFFPIWFPGRFSSPLRSVNARLFLPGICWQFFQFLFY